MANFFQKSAISALHPNFIGAIWMMGSVICFLTSNLSVKFAGETLPSIQIVFLRCLFQSLILFPLLARQGFGIMRTHSFKNYFFRLFFGVLNIVLMFYAYTRLEFATATSIVFSRPLFTIVLAAFLLNERVGWKRGAATLIGFIGILVILKPGPLGLEKAETAAIVSSLCMAAAHIYIQKLSRTENHTDMLVWFAVTAAAVTSVPAFCVWQPFGIRTLGVILVISATATLAQYCIIRAYQVGKSTVVSPLEYLQIPLSSLVGLAFFGERPTLDFIVGSAVIIAAGLYILRRRPGD